MNIEPTRPVPQMTPAHTVLESTVIANDKKMDVLNHATNGNTSVPSAIDTETQMALDEATGLIQNITTDKITDKVIRKMPTDEYLDLLKLLDTIITGSINENI